MEEAEQLEEVCPESNDLRSNGDCEGSEAFGELQAVQQASTSSVADDVESVSSNSSKRGRVRRRKRELHRKIRDQIAYYFSDSNLRHDKFMRTLTGAEAEGIADSVSGASSNDQRCPSESDQLLGTKPVPLNVFLKFNKIGQLVKTEEDIFKAFIYEPDWTAFETALVFDAKHRTISRREPYFAINSEANERTLYVERFDVNAENSYEYLRSLFDQFGSILSIRTPRFRQSKQLMGFAFIEFSESASVERAVQYFEKLAPEQAVSTSEPAVANDSRNDLKRKRPDDEADSLDGDPSTLSESDQVPPKRMKVTAADADSPEPNCTNAASTPFASNLACLRVLSKKRWNQYKNRYLKLQKSAQSAVYQLPMYNRHQCQAIKDSFDLSRPRFTGSNGNVRPASSATDAAAAATAERPQPSLCNPGSIVQLDLLTTRAQDIDSNNIRKTLRALFEQQQQSTGEAATSQLPGTSEIAFIDVSDKRIDFRADGSLKLTCYIRTHCLESANKMTDGAFCRQLTELLASSVSVEKVAVLEKNAADLYWEVVNQAKRGGRRNNNKKGHN